MEYSIIIPTHNHCDDCLIPCIESLLKHTSLSDVEIIIVANGCNDGTWSYLLQLQRRYADYNKLEKLSDTSKPDAYNSISPIKIIWTDDALGYTQATNLGIKEATGKYVVLFNNDCQILPSEKDQWVKMLSSPFANNPSVGMTGVHEIYSEETRQKFLVFYCVMIRRSIFEEIGYLDEIFSPGFGEDIDFCARLIGSGYKYVNIDKSAQQKESLMVGTFPLYHASSSTFHDKDHYVVYEKIVARNIQILKKRYEVKGRKIKYSIVIPTYNQCENLLKPCLESIKASTDLSDVEVIVVANGCVDDTAEYVNSLGEPFKLLFYKEQLGYTIATNNGIKAAQGEYIVLLNNDVILYQSPKSWLDILREPFDNGDKVGMTGVMLFKGEEGTSNDFIMFFCAMTTRSVIDEVGLLDEAFSPGGVEDIDYGLRLILAGYKLVEVPDDGKTEKNSSLSKGSFPIYHPGASTVSKEKDWDKILIRNNNYLKRKFPDYFHGVDWIEEKERDEISKGSNATKKGVSQKEYENEVIGTFQVDKPKVYDCFPFYNELDLLELRLEELNGVVDYFVISEATLTHQGHPKELIYANNKERFAKYAHKIIHIVVDDFPSFAPEEYKQHWNREQWQRHCLVNGLNGCRDNDVVIVSDADEIPNKDAIEAYKKSGSGIKSLGMKLYYYDFHHATEKTWTCAKIMRYVDIRNGNIKTTLESAFTFSSFLRNEDHEVIENGGWHLSYFTDAKGIIKKLESFSHAEYNSFPYTEERYVRMCIEDNKNLFSNDKLEYVGINESLPKTILSNIDKYQKLGFIKTQNMNQEERHKKLKELDNAVYNELFELNVNQMLWHEVKGKTVVDIGGNKGYFSIMCMEMGAKETYCFEPVKEIYDILVDVVKDFKEIHTYNIAVLDGSISEVYMHVDGAASNIWGNENKSAPVKCISFLEALSFVKDKSDMILKLDCEGSEFEIILNTPKEIFRQFFTIYIEIHDEMNPNYYQKTKLLLDHLSSLGFDMHKGLQAGTWTGDGKFYPSPICIYKLCRREMSGREKFTIGYIDHCEEDQKKYLQPSLDGLNKDDYDVWRTNDSDTPARNYNSIISSSENKYIILIHQDVTFPPDFLESIRKTIALHPDFGVLGIVGFDEFANLNRFTHRASSQKSNEVDFFDSCCIVINKEHGIMFDEKTFDEYHLYVEDYCMQAREKGLKNYTLLADFNREPDCKIKHIGTTYYKNGGKMWGKYDEYYSVFLKKWVRKTGITLRTDTAAGTVVHQMEEEKKRVCIIVMATGDYSSFVKNLVEGINAYFMPDVYKDVVVLSDNMAAQVTTLGENCVIHNVICKPVNKATYIFDLMLENVEIISKADYCYKMDADMIIYEKILSKDILPDVNQDFSIIKHFAFDQKRMSEIMPDWFSCKLPVELQDCDGWQSCLFGGRSKKMIAMAMQLDSQINNDRGRNKMWGAWEEPYVNWYFATRIELVRTLSPTYATPLYWHRFPPEYRETYFKSVGNENPKIFHFNHTVQFGGHEVG